MGEGSMLISYPDPEAVRIRAGYYQLLARLFYEEIDEAFAERFVETQPVLSIVETLSAAERSFVRGNNRMVKFLQQRTADSVTQTRCDFARVFLGAGSVTKVPISPFESVYADEGRLIMQFSRDEACSAYASEGMAVSDSFNMPEDHISFEFQYMALLLTRLADALDGASEHAGDIADDLSTAAIYRDKAESYFIAHIASWVPLFCEEAIDLARTSFYKGLLEATSAWVSLEGEETGIDIASVQKEVRAMASEAHATASEKEAWYGSLKGVA